MLTLHYHPLSSFCWKVLIALYEREVPFTPKQVDLGDPGQRDALLSIWPIGKFPVLVDDAADLVLPESSIIIEYADRFGPRPRLVPKGEAALQVRLWDRFYDSYIHLPMQKIVGDHLRPDGRRDPHGVIEAHDQIERAYDIAERHLTGSPWTLGERYGLADCAAAPALHYANRVNPIGPSRPVLCDYLKRLEARPAFARVLAEAEPYMAMFPA